MTTQFKFKVESFRRLPDPINSEKYGRYYAFCRVDQLPADFPMETNPRKQNLGTSVAKKILKGLTSEDTGPIFHHLNRGILISAKTVNFNNDSGGLLTITMEDNEVHGVVDGGHTYKIILANRDDLKEPEFVTLELMTGIEDAFDSIAGARNTSVQVKEKSLAELEGRLDLVRDLIKPLPFKDAVAYVEFDDDKDVDVHEVLSVMAIFHVALHKGSPPIYTYNSKSHVLKVYLENEASYERLRPIVPDIFRLHDHVKRTMSELYNGHFGKLKEIGYKDGKEKWPVYYSPKRNGDYERLAYDIPNGFILPILGAMRFLVDWDEKVPAPYKWKTDPFTFYDKVIGKKLVDLTMEASKELGRNPMAVGKSPRHWEGLYNAVAASYFQAK